MPNIVFYENLKAIFKKKWTFIEEEDCFSDATSFYLPMVAIFNKFWETTISENNDNDDEYNLEVDELSTLFKKWTKSGILISDSMLIEFIKHFYPDIIVEDDKYILEAAVQYNEGFKEQIFSFVNNSSI